MAAITFLPAGKSVVLSAGATSTSTSLTPTVGAQINRWLIVNSGASAVFVSITTSSSTVTLPTAGTPQTGVMLNQYDSYIIGPQYGDGQVYQNTVWVNAKSIDSTVNPVYITPVITATALNNNAHA
jgi:hypothetical protein